MDVTALLQTKIKTVVDSLTTMQGEANDIVKAYWATDASTLVTALPNATDAATLSTKLTKAEYNAGVLLMTELSFFFSNQAVSQGDYLTNCDNLKYGSHPSGAKLSEATEQLGVRMNLVALNCVELSKIAQDILNIYLDNQVNTMVAGIDAQRRVPGSDMTQDELVSGVVLVQQFKALLSNLAVTQGDYASTLAKWQTL
jgi:hypothetical protein